MILALDVRYIEPPAADGVTAVVGAVLFNNWSDETPTRAESIRLTMDIAPYEPGFFYKRELPCLLAALEHLNVGVIDTVVVDGLVFLGEAKQGLGMHLYMACPETVRSVIGVAKTPFATAITAEVLHGGSDRPLYVNSAGLTKDFAAQCISEMHGPYRIPTLLKLADTLSRA